LRRLIEEAVSALGFTLIRALLVARAAAIKIAEVRTTVLGDIARSNDYELIRLVFQLGGNLDIAAAQYLTKPPKQMWS
jgi:hypothetical protein